MLTAVVINFFLPSQAESRRTEGQILGLKPGIIIDIYPDNRRKKGKKNERKQRMMDIKKTRNKELYNNSNEMCFKMSLSHSYI